MARKFKIKYIFYAISLINIALILVFLFGSFKINGMIFQKALDKLKQEKGIIVYFDKIEFSAKKINFHDIIINIPEKDIFLKSQGVFFNYKFLELLRGETMSIGFNVNKFQYTSPSSTLFYTDNIKIEALNFTYSGNKKNLAGKGTIISKNITSTGEKSLLRGLGETLNIKSLKQFKAEDVNINLSLLADSLNFDKISINSKEFKMSGNGTHKLSSNMISFLFDTKFLPEIPGQEPDYINGWQEIKIKYYGPMEDPVLKLEAPAITNPEELKTAETIKGN